VKLVSYATSPFARKVRIAAIEAGVADQLEIVDANPLADDGVVAGQNPLGKAPALVLGDRTLVDSPLICAYLDIGSAVVSTGTAAGG
jgi:glutathione S-transferase